MASGNKSGQPLCSCGGTLLAKATPTLRENWKIWEFICWSWTSENQAYWHFCVPCHNREWPRTHRLEHGNRFTKPPDIVFASRPLVGRTLAGVAAKVVSEFYFTSAAPERRPSKAVLDKVQAALDRQRSSGAVSGGCLAEALCYRRFTASLRFHWVFTQDNYKTTTRQLQDNSQDNPQDNSFLLAGVCIHENEDFSCIFNSWTALV